MDKAILQLEIPKEFKNNLKALAALHGVSMRSYVLKAIGEYQKREAGKND